MTKKDYIIFILNDLISVWPQSEGFLMMIKKIDDKNIINSIFEIFKDEIKNISNKKILETYEKSKQKIIQMKINEKKSNLEDNNSLEELEQDLNLI